MDGWHIERTYSHEPSESAATLRKDGFAMQVLTRQQGRHTVHIWGPDGLQIKVPAVYSFDAVKTATRICQYCSATDVDTVRVGFAGRCCEKCLPAKRAEIETPGWCD